MPKPKTLTIALITAAVAISGCGRGESSSAVDVDSRFATAEALVDYYNELCSSVEPIDPSSVLELYHAENDEQRRLVTVMRDSIPVIGLDHALWEAFGAGMNPEAKASPLGPNQEPASLGASIGHRATARYVAADGTEGTLYLVQAGDRWWLSAHTLQGRGGPAAALAQVETRERMNAYIAPHASALAAKVRSGVFATQADAGYALGQAVARDHPEVATNPSLMFGARGSVINNQ